MDSTHNDQAGAKSPVSFRPSENERATLNQIAKVEGISPSDVLRRGLLLAQAESDWDRATRSMPRYPLEVDGDMVAPVVSEAADAACAVLDGLMRSLGCKYPERDGISSNFRGLLEEHLKAMLCGAEYAKKSYSTVLKPLFANYFSFGKCPSAKAQQGYTLQRTPELVSQEPVYFNEGRWVSLQQIDIGGLYTSREAAITDVLASLEARGESAQLHPLKLVVVDFSQSQLVCVS
jgi:hypothetical protein